MKRGRPNKLTKEIEEELVRVIRSGNYIETACAYVGINKTTFYDWMKKGAREKDRVEKEPKARVRKEMKPFVELSNAIEKALAHAEIRDVAIIGKSAETNWQAAAWRLERKFPDKWGRKDRQYLEHSGKNGEPIETRVTSDIDLSKLSDEEVMQFEHLISKSTNAGED